MKVDILIYALKIDKPIKPIEEIKLFQTKRKIRYAYTSLCSTLYLIQKWLNNKNNNNKNNKITAAVIYGIYSKDNFTRFNIDIG